MGCNPHYYGLSWYTSSPSIRSRAAVILLALILVVNSMLLVSLTTSALQITPPQQSVASLKCCLPRNLCNLDRWSWCRRSVTCTVCPQPEGGEDRGDLDPLMGSKSSQAVQASPASVAITSVLFITSGVANARANAGFMASKCHAEHRVRVHVDRLEKLRLECGGHLKVCHLQDSDVNAGT